MSNDAAKLTVRIVHDEHGESPRTMQDNLGEMRCWHPRYRLGDAETECPDDPEDFGAWAEEEGAVWLPLYLYDHSGLTMNTTGFSCGWDSGQVGYIYATAEHMKKCYMVDELTDDHREMAEQDLKHQVAEFDLFLRGEIYGYVIEDADGDEIDSCWGFIGDEYVREAAAEALASELATA